MPSLSVQILSKRALDDNLNNDGLGGFFYSHEGNTLRYGILFGIIFAFVAFVLLAYQHAKVRMSKGLEPLPYHRWLVSKGKRAQFRPTNHDNQTNRQQPHSQRTQPEESFSFYNDGYTLHEMPPPAYNPNYVQPPAYSGPSSGVLKPGSDFDRAPTAETSIAVPSSAAGQRN